MQLEQPRERRPSVPLRVHALHVMGYQAVKLINPVQLVGVRILHISDVEVRGTKMMGDTPRIIVAVGTIGTSTLSSSFLEPKGFIDVLCLQFCIWQWEQKGDESAKKQSFEYGKFADEE
ncbi:hypothetical protein RHMOL_Rhmol09G0142500 [Rhododendron molle]|uniref:Uncharacterized protein n=1 Tax=Rhododendron molle TaxID=49168 RepID=A0ACC0MDA5_RHOML|nr:hypothetical protein RHMOL_Rhmol09G0142500 [Rhododendron molle]